MQKLFAELGSRFRHEVRLTPALLPLLACLCGAVPMVMLSGQERLWGVCAGLGVLAWLWALLPSGCRGRQCLVFCAYLWGAGHGWWEANGRGVGYRRQLPYDSCHAELEVEIRGNPALGEGRQVQRQECEVRRVRLDEAWQDSSGRIQVMFGQGCRLRHGERWRVVGAMLPTAEDGYGRHLRSLGIWRQLEAVEAEWLAPARGWRRWYQGYLDLRERLGETLCAGMSAEYGGLYLSMVLGRRDLFTQEARMRFVRSGLLHVFAISGLHVGLVYVVFRWLLSRLSWLLGADGAVWLSCLVALGYVVMTGVTPSSCRALLMLSAVALAELCRRGVNVRQAFCLAALLELWCNPLLLLHVGFLFSFLSVAVLIYGQEPLQAVMSVIFERQQWLPGRQRHGWWSRGCVWVTGIYLLMFLAWLGSASLTLWLNGLMPLGGLVVSPLAQVLASLLVMCALPKLVLTALMPALGAWCGGGLEFLLRLLVACASWGGTAERCVWRMSPGGGETAMYALCLLVLLTFGWRWRPLRLALGWWLGCWLLAMLLGTGGRQPTVILAQGDDGGMPCVAFWEPERQRCDVVWCGGRRSAQMLTQALLRLGIRRVDEVWLSGRGETVAGVRELARQLELGCVTWEHEGRGGGRLAQQLAHDGTHLARGPGLASASLGRVHEVSPGEFVLCGRGSGLAYARHLRARRGGHLHDVRPP